ncbi:hypothetical protein AX016_0105 [Cellulophaga sp. RHA19]|nr:hypothetical protein AX016_0105 [Cellulophaga sp. RHA19]
MLIWVVFVYRLPDWFANLNAVYKVGFYIAFYNPAS